MPRPLWSGAISFGLVNIPVKLFSAVSPKEVHFHMLHEKDGARIKQKRVCAADGAEVPYEQIVKGYEVSPGRYVTITKEELEALDPKGSRTIEIQDFVELAEIEPLYYESSYHLVPDKGAAKAYALLFEAMRKTRKAAVAHFVMRSKQYLCSLRPMGKGLLLNTLLYGDEMIPQSELNELEGNASAPKGRELEMAEKLVESLSAKFDPDQYKDEYRDKVLAMLEAKAEGQEVVEPPQSDDEPKIVDLMEALRRSLESGLARGERRAWKGAEAARASAPKTAKANKKPAKSAPKGSGAASGAAKKKRSA